jgi:hypothetical protein
MNLTNLIGKQFGKLTAIEEMPPVIRNNNRRRRYLKCKCACGGEKISSWDNLRSGKINNCGCESKLHGGTGTKLYGVWRRIIQCCTDKNYAHFKNYGGRGISVCNEWRAFKNFKAWAEKSGYEAGLSIERIDNNGNYEPINCKWITMKEQARNRRTNVYIKKDGEILTATEYAKITNTPLSTVLYRVKKLRNENAI